MPINGAPSLSGPEAPDAPIVSIVMPAYNAAAYIRESIDSVVAQSFTAWELIVVDDASSDGTADFVESAYRNEPRVRIVCLSENLGAAAARNRAITLARGRFIAFLDCDDLWLPEKLSTQIEYMLRHRVALSYTSYERVTLSGQSIGVVRAPAYTSYSQMLMTSVIGCSTAVYDTAVFGKVLMPMIRMRQDYGLWLHLLKQCGSATGLREVLVRYRVRKESISANKRRAAMFTWKVYRDVEKLPLVRCCWYFANYAVRGVLRHRFPNVARRIGVME